MQDSTKQGCCQNDDACDADEKECCGSGECEKGSHTEEPETCPIETPQGQTEA